MSTQLSTVLYHSYKDAILNTKDGGYLNKKLTNSVAYKQFLHNQLLASQPIFEFNAIRTLVGIGQISNKSKLNVIDVGGGAGYHFHIASIAFPSIKFEWHVVETKSMCDSASQHAKSGLYFHESLSSVANSLSDIDLVFSSSALQYFEDPIKTLSDILDLKSRNIFITRTPLSLYSQILIAVQRSKLSDNGPGQLPHGFVDEIIEYPITYIPKKVFEETLLSSYQIKFQIEEEGASLFFENMPINGMFGYYCSLKGAI